MDKDDTGFDDVQTLLDSSLGDFDDKELQKLYDDMDRYSEVADIMETMDRYDDSQYFEELAVDTYESFCTVMQIQNDPSEWDG